MPHEPRAVVFDLDDTLYGYRRFVLSGLAAAAHRLHRSHGVDRRRAFAAFARAWRGPHRGREVQVGLATLGLSPVLVPAIVDVIRSHQPSLRLPAASAAVLRELRRTGWRLGILTNGDRAVQARKVMALGLVPHVDTVVYATDYGTGVGKPERQPFVEVARRLGVAPASTIFVGDDERCDVLGAAGAGFLPIRCTAWTRRCPPVGSVATARHLHQIPQLAHALLAEVDTCHVA